MIVGLLAAGALVVSGVIATVIGSGLPIEHVARVRAAIDRPVERVWAALTDVPAYPTWRRGVTRIERDGARPALHVEIDRRGHGTRYETLEAEPPRRLVRKLDDSGPFGGTWTFELAPSDGGTTLTIIERGTVPNPLFRFVSTYVLGQHATMRAFVEDLARHLDTTAQLTLE